MGPLQRHAANGDDACLACRVCHIAVIVFSPVVSCGCNNVDTFVDGVVCGISRTPVAPSK